MKRLFQILTCMALVMTWADAQAQDKAPLGNGNIALKLDYITFTDSYFDERGNQDDGLYIGLEGYGRVATNWYLGGEIGTGTNIDLFGGEDITFVPIEINLKYAKETASNFVVDVGAGLSFSYAEIQYHPFLGGVHEERDDWLLGGQVFADLTYKINWFLVGVNAKYQMTGDFEDSDVELSNWRLGVHLGIVF